MLRKNNLTLLLIVCWLSVSALAGCARLAIPAPDAPVQPLKEWRVEKSVIYMPITVSIKSIAGDLGRMFSTGKGTDATGREDGLSGKIQDFIKRQASKLETDNLAQNIYVRQAAGRAWDALQGPIKLTDDLVLMLNPRAVTVSSPPGPADTINVVIGLVAEPKLVNGIAPTTAGQLLPEISFTPVPKENGFHVAVESELSFDYIGNELTKRMEEKPYIVDGKTIIVEKVRVYGSGDSIVLAVSVRGTIKGVLYLSGTPAYDEETRSLSVKNPEYTVETKQVLVHAADWLLHSKLQEGIAARATWFIGDKIDSVKTLLSASLNRQVNQHMKISGVLRSLRPVAVGITPGSLKAVLIADGTAQIDVL